jgi:hypothetical protein
VATPSQQTNQILSLLETLSKDSHSHWIELSELIERRLDGQQRSREEFESKAEARGESFLESAAPKLEAVQANFDRYANSLREILQHLRAKQVEAKLCAGELALATQALFESLDAYAAFYFAWGETQSPLVTMIRQAVESYSRTALQSTQAQRILQDMQQHLATTEDNPRAKDEGASQGCVSDT